MADIYDSIIIGAGPAGLAAALYSARDRYKTLVLEKFFPGGQIINTDRIENYPGFENISGPDLVERFKKQAQSFGAEIKTAEVKTLTKLPDGNIEVNCGKKVFIAKSVIIACGSEYRKLNVPGEAEYRNAGAGVSYCGTCDAPFFKGKTVVAVGGGNTAVEENALHVAKFAGKLTLVHRRQEFRATKILVEELMHNVNSPEGNIKLQLDSVITAIEGGKQVEKVKVKNVITNAESAIPCDGVFIFVGTLPNTGFLKGFVDITEDGFIKCDPATLRTKVPGVFVAGDCRIGAGMQLATATGDGVNAAILMKQYLRDPGWWTRP